MDGWIDRYRYRCDDFIKTVLTELLVKYETSCMTPGFSVTFMHSMNERPTTKYDKTQTKNQLNLLTRLPENCLGFDIIF